MSIETLLTSLIAAVEANTAALQGAAPTATAGSSKPAKAAPSKPAKAEKPAGPKHSKAEMQAALNEVKESLGTAQAKQLIKNAGFDKLADVTEDKFDELYDAAKALVEGDSGDDAAADDGL